MRLTAHTVLARFHAHGSPVSGFLPEDIQRISRHLLAVRAVLPVPLPRVSGITLSI